MSSLQRESPIVDAAGSATLISVVHNPALLPLLAKRVIGMRRGRIVFDLPIESVDSVCLDNLYRQEGDAAIPIDLEGSL